MQKLRLAGCIAALPLLSQLPYICRAWRTSPLDAHDWLFVPCFIVVLAAALYWHKRVATTLDKHDYLALLPLVISVAGMIGARRYDIHAIFIASSIVFWWAICWLAYGWRMAYALIPPFGILSMLTTSSTYWLCFFLEISPAFAFALKCAFALGCASLCAVILTSGHVPCRRTVTFCVFFLASIVLQFHVRTAGKLFPAANLPFVIQCGGYLGVELPVDENFRRFFRTSDARQFRYIGDEYAEAVSLLRVKCGADIHEVHPASHCLRSSGWQIDSEQMMICGYEGRQMQVSEVLAKRDGVSMLVWCWYSSPDVSTGSYLTFRRKWNANTQWTIYQLSVPCYSGIEDARAVLTDFLQELSEL